MNNENKIIKKFSIYIGQDAVCGVPIGDPIIKFTVNNSWILCRLEDFKNWINDIYESKGNRSKKAYEAKKQLDMLFAELFHNVKEYKE